MWWRMTVATAVLIAVVLPCAADSIEGDDRVPFHEGVLAALSRQGCSAGACHGSPTGKGGFRLSLRGFDPVLDEQTLIREDFGRRVNPHDPESSLLLLKPLMAVSHGGGQKLRKTDPAYAILRDWIAQGARPDSAGAVASLKIEVQPKQAELRHPAWTQQLHVVGHFSDGSTRDLTHLAVFSSSDESVASVNADGLVTGTSRGEATILVRYLDHIDTVIAALARGRAGLRLDGAAASQLHRRACVRQAEEAAACAGRIVERLRVHPPRLSRYDRSLADAVGGRGVCCRWLAREAERADRPLAGAAGVRRATRSALGRCAPREEWTAGVGGCSQATSLAGRGDGAEHAVRRACADATHRRGEHAGESTGQLLSGGSRHERMCRSDRAALPGGSHPVRQVPQPSVRSLVAGSVSRPGSVLRPRAAEDDG